MNIVAPTAEGIEEAVRALRAGRIVAYPTETVYGLAVDPFSETALKALFAAKGRPETNPVLVILSDIAQLPLLVDGISPRARAYMEAFWPGPLSLLFPKGRRVPELLTAGLPKVCVRQPACAAARDLCAAFGGPLTSSSANLSGAPPARSLDEVTVPDVAVGIDGGLLPPSPPSTLFDPDEQRILREGAIPADLLLRMPV